MTYKTIITCINHEIIPNHHQQHKIVHFNSFVYILKENEDMKWARLPDLTVWNDLNKTVMKTLNIYIDWYISTHETKCYSKVKWNMNARTQCEMLPIDNLILTFEKKYEIIFSPL